MACGIMAMMSWTDRGSIEDGNDAPKWRLVPVCIETADRARIELPCVFGHCGKHGRDSRGAS